MTQNKKLKQAARAQQARMGGSYTAARAVVVAGRKFPTARLFPLIKALLPLADSFAREAVTPGEIWLGPDFKLQNHFSRKRPAEEALRTALGALSLDDLHVIETVMYAGRDLKDAETAEEFRDHHIELRRNDSSITIMNISSKVPLPTYLHQGLILAERLGVDLDALPPSPRSPIVRRSQ